MPKTPRIRNQRLRRGIQQMTDSQNDDGGGLQTAGYRTHFDHKTDSIRCQKTSHLPESRTDELVRRSDVKALIQDRGFTIQQCIRKGRSEEAIEKLDELLEELEQ